MLLQTISRKERFASYCLYNVGKETMFPKRSYHAHHCLTKKDATRPVPIDQARRPLLEDKGPKLQDHHPTISGLKLAYETIVQRPGYKTIVQSLNGSSCNNIVQKPSKLSYQIIAQPIKTTAQRPTGSSYKTITQDARPLQSHRVAQATRSLTKIQDHC